MRNIGAATMAIAFLFWYGFGYLQVRSTSYIDLTIVNITITVFMLFVSIGYISSNTILSKRIQSNSYKMHHIGNRSFFIAMTTILLMLSFTLIVASRGMIAYHSVRIQVSLGIICYVMFQLFHGPKRFVFLFIFLLVTALSLDYYSRRPFLTLFSAVILIPLIRNSYRKGTLLVFALCILFFSYLSISYITGLRYTSGSISLLDAFNNIAVGNAVLLRGEGFDTVYLTNYVISNFDKYNSLYGSSFLGGFVNFVPRFIWESKPIAFGVLLSSMYYNVPVADLFTNFGPGIVAESYANGGYFAVVVVAYALGITTGAADYVVDNNRENWNIIIFAIMFFPSLFFMVRGDFLNSFYEFYSKYAIALIVINIAGMGKRLRNQL